MAKAQKDVVMVRAYVDRAIPDRTQYKPYATELTFGGRLAIDLPVPAEEVVEQDKDLIVLTANGYASLLQVYTLAISRMNDRANQAQFDNRKF